MVVANEKGNELRGNGDLCSLVGEDKEGSKDSCFIVCSKLKGLYVR